MKLWGPSKERIARSNLKRFCESLPPGTANNRNVGEAPDFSALYSWSIKEPQKFWQAVFEFCGIISDGSKERVLIPGKHFWEAHWFPDVMLNFAENLLRYRDDHEAIVFWGENAVRRTLSYRHLAERVASLTAVLRELGIKPGDRVAGFLPHMPETIIAMLAAASLGATWSSCSPDFGAAGVLDRFGQISPKVLFTADGYFHKGTIHDCFGKISEILPQLPSVEKVFVIRYTEHAPLPPHPQFEAFDAALAKHPNAPLTFERFPFQHPLYIMFSSGTTGKPKCIVHSAGGTLLEHMKELVLHTDLTREDRFFYQTTTGWMMWNWFVSGLSVGATHLVYDGAPFHENGTILFRLAEEEKMTIFGTNAKFIAAVEKAKLEPKKIADLSALRTILSTGSPLLPESFDFVYRSVKSDVLLSSISGGTDIIGCFGLGSPISPVHRSQIQVRSLGLEVQVFDESGQAVVEQKGELVCSAPFPSMPICFWNDSDNEKYRKAYFEKYPGVWHHGDYVELTKEGGLIMYGRSDAVLNPGGIRIGTAEIYRQVESIDAVEESIVIGQEWKGDVRVVLFVKLREGLGLSSELKEQIRMVIRTNTTAHHVPKKIIQVEDIPRTRSGKIVELAVRNVVHNEPVKNSEALLNPEALDLFKNINELQTD